MVGPFLYWALGPNFQKKGNFFRRPPSGSGRHLYYKTCAKAKCCTKNGNTSSFDNHDETFIFPRDVLDLPIQNVNTIFHSFDTAKILLAYLGKDHQYMSIHHDLILYKRPRRTKARDCYSFAVGDGHNLDYKMTTGSRSTNFRPWLNWENGFNLDTWRKRRRAKWVLFTNFSINATAIR